MLYEINLCEYENRYSLIVESDEVITEEMVVNELKSIHKNNVEEICYLKFAKDVNGDEELINEFKRETKSFRNWVSTISLGSFIDMYHVEITEYLYKRFKKLENIERVNVDITEL
ncbi:MAG: hypothetical protein ACRDBY_12845 [Cetobacterium sp.]